MTDKYQAVIGLEVHVELATKEKIFCTCPTEFAAPPNTQICPVCMGLPGSLPTLNRDAVRLCILAGLATGCTVSEQTRFDRKNYFYPDLPKAYQISQYEFPICKDGKIETEECTVRIERIHLEEDAGKLIHDAEHGTLVDYNRCGVPLIEIVSHPDMHTSDEAKAYLKELRVRLLSAGISDCRMDKGSLRCDVNISVRPRTSQALGTKVEMKNINSFAFVGKAIDFEFERQVKILESGGTVVSETRRFDEKSGETRHMRTKESAADYRFFPEPDLLPFVIDRSLVKELRATLPKMPDERRREYEQKYSLRHDDAKIISSRPQAADYYERAAALTEYPRIAANILIGELMAVSDADGFECPVDASELAEIATLFGNGTINSSTVKKLIALTADSEKSPRELVQIHGLAQISDRDYIRSVLDTVLSETPKLPNDYKNGKSAAEKAIIGKVMAATKGKANPIVVSEIWGQIKAGL